MTALIRVFQKQNNVCLVMNTYSFSVNSILNHQRMTMTKLIREQLSEDEQHFYLKIGKEDADLIIRAIDSFALNCYALSNADRLTLSLAREELLKIHK
jgi:hypothetical protein